MSKNSSVAVAIAHKMCKKNRYIFFVQLGESEWTERERLSVYIMLTDNLR